MNIPSWRRAAQRRVPRVTGDVAVLCRTNDRLKQVATACAHAGIPVAFKRPALFGTPEGVLALACLRRLADPRDTLATAEIRTLTQSEAPDAWLAERMTWLEGEEPGWRWGEVGDDALPQLAALAEVRADLSIMTPSEAAETALIKGGVREAAIAWGPTADHARHRPAQHRPWFLNNCRTVRRPVRHAEYRSDAAGAHSLAGRSRRARRGLAGGGWRRSCG